MNHQYQSNTDTATTVSRKDLGNVVIGLRMFPLKLRHNAEHEPLHPEFFRVLAALPRSFDSGLAVFLCAVYRSIRFA